MTFPNVPLANQWTDGEEITATKLNARIDNNFNALIPGFTSYAPTWTNLTVGNGNNQGYYRLVGKILTLKIVFVLGTTSSVATAGVTFTLPSGLSASSLLSEQWIFAAIAGSPGISHGDAQCAANATTMSIFLNTPGSSALVFQFNTAAVSLGTGGRIIVTGDIAVN